MVTFPDSHRTVFTFRKLVRFARCCTSVLDFHSRNLQITSKLLIQGYRYHKLRKTFGKFFRSYSELLSKFGDISFSEYVSCGVVCVVTLPFDISVGVGAFVIRLSQISILFPFNDTLGIRRTYSRLKPPGVLTGANSLSKIEVPRDARNVKVRKYDKGSAHQFYAAIELTHLLTKLDVVCIFFSCSFHIKSYIRKLVRS